MKFNKILFTVVLMVLCTGVQSIAKTVDENTARTIGMNFLKGKGIALSGTTSLITVYTANGTVNGKTVASYYVFNVSGANAFVMVSADDIIRPILAYSDQSAFDMNHMSPSAKNWVDGYRNQITAAIANKVPAKSITATSWSELKAGVPSWKNARTTAVSALLTTKWDQAPGTDFNGFYNDSCPGIGANQAVTGCVATAMAQVMKFWNWPTVGTGYLSYYSSSYSETLSANFGNTVYGWSTMQTPELTSHDPSVAQLMFHNGVSTQMQYTDSESGTYVLESEAPVYNISAEYALKTYYHYSRSLIGIPRFGVYGDGVDSIPEATWITMLQTELNAGRPVIYDGQGPVGGHCWVCDGWETTSNMFHFNWGWSGASDGYYTVDNLAPPALGVGGGMGNFNSDQGAIFGVQPDSFPNTPGNIQLLAHLNATTSTPMDYGTSMSISTQILNSNSTSFTGDFAMQVFDTLNNLVGTIQTYTGETIAAGDSAAYTFGPSVLYAMIPMDYYHLQAMYRPFGTTTWTPVANNGTYVNYTTADVLNDTDIALYDNINVVSSVPVISGSALTVNAQLFDQGTVNFNGTIQAVMINVATGTSYLVQALPGQSMVAYTGYGSLTPLSVSFTNSTFTAPGGLYALVIQQQYNGSGNFYTTSSDYYENPILLTVDSAGSTSVASTSMSNDVYVFPNPAKDMITILPQGVNVTDVHIFDVIGREIQKQILAKGKSAIVVPVTDLAPGEYIIRLQTDNGVLTRNVIIAR